MKISIIGVGAVGQAAANALITRRLASELVLFDINCEAAQAAMLDLQDALPLVRANTQISCAKSASECINSDVIVLSFTAGIAASRPAELAANLAILQDLARSLAGYCKILLIATNPNDAIVFHARRLFNLAASKVIGTGTSLDSARLIARIGRDLGVEHEMINACMIGEHGDSQLALFSSATIGALDIRTAYKNAQIAFCPEQIEHDVAYRGHEIFRLKGKTEYGIASVIARIISAIRSNENALICASSCISAQFSSSDLIAAEPENAAAQAYSRPLIIGQQGILCAPALRLDDSERDKFIRSIEFIRTMC